VGSSHVICSFPGGPNLRRCKQVLFCFKVSRSRSRKEGAQLASAIQYLELNGDGSHRVGGKAVGLGGWVDLGFRGTLCPGKGSGRLGFAFLELILRHGDVKVR